MKVVIFGSRAITHYDLLCNAIRESGWESKITCVVSGTARGVDELGERWAKERGIPVERFPADWAKHGRKAGFIRNGEMGQVAEAGIGLQLGHSPGTENMVRTLKKLGKPVYHVRTPIGEYAPVVDHAA